MKNLIKIIFVAIVLGLLLALGPICIIWSLNTLFPVLIIPYTVETWLAIVIIGGIFRSGGSSFKGTKNE